MQHETIKQSLENQFKVVLALAVKRLTRNSNNNATDTVDALITIEKKNVYANAYRSIL